MKNSKKLTAINIISKIVQWLPIGIYGCFNLPEFYQTTESGITISAVFLMIIVLLYFKDSVKQWLTKPSTFNFVLISWIFSLVFVVLGEKIFVISSILLASFLSALPLEAWAKCIKKEATENSVFQELKEMLTNK